MTLSPHIYRSVQSLLGNVPTKTIVQESFKEQTASARAIVRTGEFTTYANIILIAGWCFDTCSFVAKGLNA